LTSLTTTTTIPIIHGAQTEHCRAWGPATAQKQKSVQVKHWCHVCVCECDIKTTINKLGKFA